MNENSKAWGMFKDEAANTVKSDMTYVAAIAGGLVRAFVTKSAYAGISYAVAAVGFQVVWNGVSAVIIEKHYEKKEVEA